MKNRQNSNETWPFMTEEERGKCCKEQDPASTGESQDCVEAWKKKLDEKRQEKEKADAVFNSAKKTHTNAASWKEKLERWKKNTEEAHKLASVVESELSRFVKAVARTKPAETANAVKAVLCLVKSIFDRVKDLLRISAEDPKGKIQEVRQWIECHPKLDAKTKENALACIGPFEDQMKVVYEAQQALLNKLLEILHCAHVLVAAVDKSGPKENAGLEWQIRELHQRISGKPAEMERAKRCGGGEAPTSLNPPCELANPPKLLPIEDSAYYKGIVKLYEDAETKLKTAKETMDKAKETSDKAAACYNGLNDAIKAAEAAEVAK